MVVAIDGTAVPGAGSVHRQQVFMSDQLHCVALHNSLAILPRSSNLPGHPATKVSAAPRR